MCKFKIAKTRLPASVCLSALLGLSALLLPAGNALAVDQIAGGTVVTPGVAHVNDTVFIQGVDAAESLVDNGATNIAGWLVKPNNTFQLIFTNGVATPNQCVSCPPSFVPLCTGPVSCVPGVNLTYVVNALDIGDAISFTIPPGFPSAGTLVPLPGKPNYVRFLAEVSAFSILTGLPIQASGPADVLVVNPSISVTKQCVTNCTPGSSEYGLPIGFTGTVCNTGDDTLINVVVTDTPPATIVFSTTTSFGTNGFPAAGGGRLLPGECVNFSGTYTPAGTGAALCGPFTDQVVASGTESATGPFKFQTPGTGTISLTNLLTVRATNSATCFVCTTPCIQVLKNCGPLAIDLATGSFQVSGSVSNCGNVPLSGVLVIDTITNRPSSGPVTVTTVTTSLGPVAPHTSIAIPAQTITVTNCGSISDFFRVIGTNVCGGTVTSTSLVCTTAVTNQACIGVSKVCGPALLDFALNPSFTVSGSVTNCGNLPLTGVNVTDTITNANGVVTTVTVLANATVPAHSAVAIPVSTITATGCGTVSDFFSASGNGPCGPASATSLTCRTVLTNTPCMAVVKTCGPATVNVGSSYTVSGFVTNCGSGPLTSIVVNDIVTAPSGSKTTNAVSLSSTTLAGHSALAFGPITIPTSATNCGPYQDQFVVTALGLCGNPAPASSAVCTTTTIGCTPNIAVYKGVTCGPAGANPTCTNGTYLAVDTGAEGAAFCYRIIVSNPSPNITLIVTNMTDTIISGSGTAPALLGFSLPLTLAPLQSVTNFPGPIVQPLGTNVNQVVATGVDVSRTFVTQAVATATAIVKPMGVSCDITLTSAFNLNTNGTGACPVTLPAGSSNSPVAVALTLHNTGQVDLNVRITGGSVLSNTLFNCADDVTPVSVANLVVFVPANTSVTTNLGCVLVSCPGTSITATVRGTAVASTAVPCIYDSTGAAVQTAPSSCNACVNCAVALSCRVTGGGTLYPNMTDTNCVVVTTTLFDDQQPADVTLDHISHGGQLGAPFSMPDCGEILGNPCIRGQWQHNRHYQGTGNPRDQIDADFHSNTPKGVFDTLMCACLGCCSDGQFIGSAIANNLCNPEDHKICGPQPRPAPANAIIFTGIGTFKPATNNVGGRAAAARYVIFRVYIEDRSEPGGLHPGGAKEPADVYVFQAWDTGIPTEKKKDFSTVATAFRKALAADSCAFINSISTSTATGLPPGSLPPSTVAGMPADIVDQGPLYNGNQQIHPSTSAICP